ncbi:hypothetical protein HN873_029694 [Arachis hypogaea]
MINCDTEGNLHGILVGREVLPDGILYASQESHYSVFKAARMYRMDCMKIVTLHTGEIDCNDFKAKLLLHKDKPAIVNVIIGKFLYLYCPSSLALFFYFANVHSYRQNFAGTTVKGAVDDLDLVIKTLEDTGYSRDKF